MFIQKEEDSLIKIRVVENKTILGYDLNVFFMFRFSGSVQSQDRSGNLFVGEAIWGSYPTFCGLGQVSPLSVDLYPPRIKEDRSSRHSCHAKQELLDVHRATSGQ